MQLLAVSLIVYRKICNADSVYTVQKWDWTRDDYVIYVVLS